MAAVLLIGCTFFLTYCTDKTSFVDIDDELNPLRYEIITDDLEIPWQMDFAPHGRIFITERNGLVKIIENDQLSDQVWLDLRDSLQTSYGPTVTNSGFLGIAIDPDFSSNRYVYIGYSTKLRVRIMISINWSDTRTILNPGKESSMPYYSTR